MQVFDILRNKSALGNFGCTSNQQVKIINQLSFSTESCFLTGKLFNCHRNRYYIQVGTKLTDFLHIGFHGIATFCAI